MSSHLWTGLARKIWWVGGANECFGPVTRPCWVGWITPSIQWIPFHKGWTRIPEAETDTWETKFCLSVLGVWSLFQCLTQLPSNIDFGKYGDHSVHSLNLWGRSGLHLQLQTSTKSSPSHSVCLWNEQGRKSFLALTAFLAAAPVCIYLITCFRCAF